jgi:hypothetical protein
MSRVVLLRLSGWQPRLEDEVKVCVWNLATFIEDFMDFLFLSTGAVQ